MDSALAWIGQIAAWVGRFIPQWQILDSREGAVKFQTLLLRDLVRCRWDPSCKATALGPGLHAYWPAVTELRTWVVARQSVNLATQTLCTTDGKVLAVGGVLVFRIADALRSIAGVWNPDDTIRALAAGALHDVCSAASWDELQCAKADGTLVRALRSTLRKRLRPFGVTVLTATLTDFAPARVLKVIQSTSQDV